MLRSRSARAACARGGSSACEKPRKCRSAERHRHGGQRDCGRARRSRSGKSRPSRRRGWSRCAPRAKRRETCRSDRPRSSSACPPGCPCLRRRSSSCRPRPSPADTGRSGRRCACVAREEGAAVGPIHPAVEDQHGVIVAPRPCRNRDRGVHLGDAGVVAAESIGIDAVALRRAGAHVAPR